MELKEAKEIIKNSWLFNTANENIGLKEAISTILKELEHLQKENGKLTRARKWFIEHTIGQIATPEMLRKILEDEYIHKDEIREKIEQLKREISYIAGECDEGCNKCFDKDWKPLYRGANFNFCYAYHQIKVLQDLLKEE